MEKTEAIILLAIDDKPDNLTTLSAVVREALPQTRILTATNGPAGIELAAAENPDVILLDIVMPGIDGFEVCRRLKADDRIKDIPVVFLTALKTDIASRVKALEIGAEGFLSKPLETVELTAQIQAMTKVKAANRSQRTEKDHLEALVAERTRELQESESRYHAMFENMASASCMDEIVYKDGRAVDYRILDVNPAYERITGIRRQEAAGALASALYGLGQAPFLDIYGRVAETGEPADFEAWFEPLQKHLHITVGRPKQGFFSTVFTDITERKHAEAQLRFQAHLIDNSPVMAAYHDKDLNLVWVNRAYQKATGLSLEEVRGKKCYQVWNLSKPCRACPVITAMETGEIAAHELTPDNQDHWPESQGYWLSQAAPVRDEQGAVIGAIEFSIDITERKQGEEKIAEQLHEMQRWHNVMLDREGRVIELKKEVNELLVRGGETLRYISILEEGAEK